MALQHMRLRTLSEKREVIAAWPLRSSLRRWLNCHGISEPIVASITSGERLFTNLSFSTMRDSHIPISNGGSSR
jgi:hypothetical protein